LFTWIFKSTCF